MKRVFPADVTELHAKRIREYYTRLAQRNISVPAVFKISIEEGRIVEYATDVGTDCRAVVLSDPARFPEIVRGMTLGTLPLLTADQREVGFDSHPANWCVDEAGRYTYVDFKPPRYRDGDVFLVGIPQPDDLEDVRIGTWRYYSREGILRRLIYSCERLVPGEGRCEVLEVLGAAGPECAFWATQYLESLPARRVERDLSKFDETVRALAPDDADDLRELAVVVVERLHVGKDLLEQVLKLSHMTFSLPRAERHSRFEQARQLLLSVEKDRQ